MIRPVIYKLAIVTILFFSSISIFIVPRVLFIGMERSPRSDFISFMVGARIISEGKGHFLYDEQIQLKYFKQLVGDTYKLLPFRSLPVTALLYIPLVFFNLSAAYRICIVFNIIFLIVWATSYRKEFGSRYVPLILIFSFVPILPALINCQQSILLAAVLTLVYRYGKNNLLRGMLIGLMAFKPQFILPASFIFFIMSKNKREYLKGLMVTSSVLFFISALFSGWTFPYDLVKFILFTESSDFGSHANYYSLQPLLNILFFGVSNVAGNLIANFGLLLILGTCLTKVKDRFSYEKQFAISVLVTFVFSYHVLENDLVLLLPVALIYAARLFREKEKPVALSFLVMAFYIYPLVFIDYFLLGDYLSTLINLVYFSALKAMVVVFWLFWEIFNYKNL
jgi:hypothetical protein